MIGMLQRVNLQERERRFFECGERPCSCIRPAGALVESSGMEIFQVRDQLVDGRLRQLHAGLADMAPYFYAGVKGRHKSPCLYAGDLRQRRDEARPVLAL